jgi:putative transposase
LIVNTYQNIVVGDVSSLKLARTRMATAVLDTGWGMLRQMLLYKGENAGRSVRIVNERNTTRGWSNCGALTGPSGLRHLVVRQWECVNCGESHDRDVNAARNILIAGSRCGTPVRGNELSPDERAPSQTPRLRKAGSHAPRAAA